MLQGSELGKAGPQVMQALGAFHVKDIAKEMMGGGMLPSMQDGGTVPSTGPYLLHEGETVVPSKDSATLPGPPMQDPQKTQQMLKLLQTILPSLGQSLGQPQGGGQPQPQGTPQRPGIQIAPTAPAQMQTKFDPTSSVGSLPQPVAQPGPSPYQVPSGSNELISKLDPRGAATFMGVQGVTQFIHETVQKKDMAQKAEAANAAQALMSALEGAKTTGDFSPAQHIFENNEALFNKVYKGWIQKTEEAKKESQKPKKEAKPPDPEVEGFEQGLASYLGKGAAKQPGQPQPPSTLTGKSGAKYFMPQAAPPQAIAQQSQSDAMQQQRQQPGQPILTPAQRVEYDKMQVELQKNQVDLQKSLVGFQEARTKLQQATVEQQKAEAEAQSAKQRGITAEQMNQSKLLGLNTQLDINKARLENTILQGKNIKARGSLSDKISAGYKVRFAAIDQAEQMLNTMKADKRDFSPSDVRDLQQHLTTAGARTLATSLNKTFNNHWYMPDSFTKPTVDDLLSNLKEYKQNLLVITPAQQSDGTVDKSDDESADEPSTDDSGAIVVSPEDLK